MPTPLSLTSLLCISLAVASAATAQRACEPWTDPHPEPDSIDATGRVVFRVIKATYRWPEAPHHLYKPLPGAYHYYRDVFPIEMDSTLSQAQLDSFQLAFNAEPLGTFTSFGNPLCLFKFPDPGDSLPAVGRLLTALRSYPGVRSVVPQVYESTLQLR